MVSKALKALLGNGIPDAFKPPEEDLRAPVFRGELVSCQWVQGRWVAMRFQPVEGTLPELVQTVLQERTLHYPRRVDLTIFPLHRLAQCALELQLRHPGGVSRETLGHPGAPWCPKCLSRYIRPTTAGILCQECLYAD